MTFREINEWFNRRPMVIDGIFAVLLALIVFPSTPINHCQPGSLAFLGCILWGLLQVLVLVWRRTRPTIMVAGTAVCSVLTVIFCDSFQPSAILVPIAIFASVTYGRTRRGARAWLAVAMAGAALAGWRWGWYITRPYGTVKDAAKAWGTFSISCALVVLLAWFAGSFARARRLNLLALRQRAEDLERERDQRIKLATQEERARIAREMHDIVAHSLSVIVVQADGGAYLAHHEEVGDLQARLDSAASALDTIAETAREALTQTRRLVGVLRDDSGEPLVLSPAETLDSIPELIERTQSVLDVALSIEGAPDSHPPLERGAEFAIYRVVQESLTNIIKHAGPQAHALVTIIHRPSGVRVEIVDDGSGAPEGASSSGGVDGGGHGLVGMRERIGAWGGTVEAGNRAAGGFRVFASVPVTAAEGEDPSTEVGEHRHS